MYYTIEQIQNGVLRYVEQELASKAVGIRKFGIYFIMPTIKRTVAEYIHKFRGLMPDIIDDKLNINLDQLYNQSKDAIKQSGQFEFMGVIFNEADVDSLYNYIKTL